jgi:CHAT domain-containing protein
MSWRGYYTSYVSNGRDLLRLSDPGRPASSPLIVAHPDFGDPSLPASASRVLEHATAERRVAELPGTRREAQRVRALLPGATVLIRTATTEQAVKGLLAPSLLHVPTHGSFLGDIAAVTLAGTDAVYLESPLLRSGLVLAGANTATTNADDGLLTALEVAGLYLWGTRLVVLSTCDTGVGEISAGDGVHGLRRALVVAGSQSQVISLWSVADRPTADLMITVYSGLVNEHRGRAEALRDAQLRFLASRSRRHPYYWAAFILSGDWRPLP